MKLQSLYICVKDMDRAVEFYEELLNQKVTEKDDLYSVFVVHGFRFGLFAYQKMKEEHIFGSNCLPSIDMDSLEELKEKINGKEICFPLTQIKKRWVAEIVDSEGNHIEITAPVEAEPNELLDHLEQLHTTELSQIRIQKNVNIQGDVAEWCRNRISQKDAKIKRRGKNWYIQADGYEITVNAGSYTVITAKKVKFS